MLFYQSKRQINIFILFICLQVAFLTRACSFAESTISLNSAHIYGEMSSVFLKLIVDADTTDIRCIESMPIYVSGYALAQTDTWLELFFDTNTKFDDGFEGFHGNNLWQQMV